MDNLSNFLSSLKNIRTAGKYEISVNHSNLVENVAIVLKDRGFLELVEVSDNPKIKNAKIIKAKISSIEGAPAISEVKRISKSGVRVYTGYKNIKKILGGRGVSIISTTKGVMTGEDAYRQRLGGEILCEIY